VGVSDLLLLLCVLLAGLWSGLLLTVTTLLHPMFRAMDGRRFALEMERFLPIAQRSPTNWILVVGLLLAPVASLVALRDGTTAFVLTAVGLAACVAGPLLVSRFLAEPNYAVILAWDPEAMPADWTRTRRLYFRLNWVRALATWSAFGLFAAAAYAAWA
jgi:hypothetical protein